MELDVSVGIEEAGERATSAVFIAHGMGQQVPFATLNDVAEGIARTAGGTASYTARTVLIGHDLVQRLELTLTKPEEPPRRVDLYEAYWAPLTEGVVTLRDTMRFLVSGAMNGSRCAAQKFPRLLFNQMVFFNTPRRTVIWLAVALAIVVTLTIANATIAAVAAARFALTRQGWATQKLVDDLAASFDVVLIVGVAAGVLIFVSMRVPALRRILDWPIVILLTLVIFVTVIDGAGVIPALFYAHIVRGVQGRLLQIPYAGTVMLIVIGIAVAVVTLLFALKLIQFIFRKGPVLDWLVMVLGAVLAALVLAVLFFAVRCFGFELHSWFVTFIALVLLSAFVRWFLIEFGGDVAAYVQPQKVDRFYDLRRRIKETALQMAKAVYTAQPQYERVIIVGHSLGSVIVYGTLNRLINGNLTGEKRTWV